MDFHLLVQIVILVVNLFILRLAIQVRKIVRDTDRRSRLLLDRTTSRQSGVRGIQFASQASPPIDARARTVRRNTDDLPHTGRMGALQPRSGGDDDGFRDDAGLP